MSFDIQNKAIFSGPKKKVRIGSRVPEGNREWLKSHGIVTDQALSYKSSSFLFKKSTLQIEKPAIVAVAFLISLLPLVWFQQQKSFMAEIKAERARTQSLIGSNQHLLASMAQFSAIISTQQAEINRMAAQLQELTQRFRSQIGGLEKGEAMSDALHHVFENELGRMSYRYDLEVEALRKQVFDKEQMISSLETSLQSMEGVVVRAEPFSSSVSMGMTNGTIAAINDDFQFVVVNLGELKGAKLGQMVEFYHQGVLIGYGQVEKVYPDFSGVKVFSYEVMSQLEQGDAVFLGGPSA